MTDLWVDRCRPKRFEQILLQALFRGGSSQGAQFPDFLLDCFGLLWSKFHAEITKQQD